jgi:hypothetical protein
MSTSLSVSQLAAKAHDAADEVRTPEKTRLEIVRLPGYTLGRLTLQPGWRWSACIKPVVGGDACQLAHVGYALSGQLAVRLDDGTERTIHGGESYTIPPGHDGWVVGDAPFVGLEVLNAEHFARPAAPDARGGGNPSN